MSSQQIVGHIFPSTHIVSPYDKRRVMIDNTPDDVLLIIFYFHGVADDDPLYPSWQRLVHVCRRWRSVVFASPKFLDLRLVFNPTTRVELAGVWPPFPIIIRNMAIWKMSKGYDFEAAVVHRSRVREIDLCLSDSQLQLLDSVMQEPFPVLRHLKLEALFDVSAFPVLSDGFLGGSSPHMQSLELCFVSFPALPKLLLSATDLVHLTLWDICCPGFILPETLVTCLAVMANLKSLAIKFDDSLLARLILGHNLGGLRHSLPSTRTVLPALTRFNLFWVAEYLEVLVAHIGAPLLDSVCITSFHQIRFDIPQFDWFTRRTTMFQALNEAHVDFDLSGVHVKSLPPTQTFDEESGFRISCHKFNWESSDITHALTSLPAPICMVEHLYIYGPGDLPVHYNIYFKDMQWLGILRPFISAKNLYLRKEVAQCIAPALQELVGDRAAHVLPALESIFLEELEPSGPVQEAIEQFVAARQFLGLAVAVSHWNEISSFDDLPPHSI